VARVGNQAEDVNPLARVFLFLGLAEPALYANQPGGFVPACGPRRIVKATKEEIDMTDVHRSVAHGAAIHNSSCVDLESGIAPRATLFDNGDFAYFAEVTPVCKPVGGFCLKISSRMKSSRDADAEQVQFQACLDTEGLRALAALIAKQVAA
jgi:hypothetical protein